MESRVQHPETTIRITRRFRAPRQRVFSACLEPDQLRRWWAPPGFRFADITIDPETGYGRRFTMVGPEGQRFVWEMVYTLVDPPNRIEWRSIPVEGFKEVGETVGILEFDEVVDGTEVRLTQEGYPDRASRDVHQSGWGKGFESLEGLLRP